MKPSTLLVRSYQDTYTIALILIYSTATTGCIGYANMSSTYQQTDGNAAVKQYISPSSSQIKLQLVSVVWKSWFIWFILFSD